MPEESETLRSEIENTVVRRDTIKQLPDAAAELRPNNPEKLAPDGVVKMPLIPDSKYKPLNPRHRFEFGDGTILDAEPVCVVRIGGEETYTDVVVIDSRDKPMVRSMNNDERGYTPVRAIAVRNSKPLTMAGDYHILIPGSDNGTAEFRSLTPESPIWNIGRGFTNDSELLPDTVSGNHCAIKLERDRKGRNSVVVENHAPTNQTLVFR